MLTNSATGLIEEDVVHGEGSHGLHERIFGIQCWQREEILINCWEAGKNECREQVRGGGSITGNSATTLIMNVGEQSVSMNDETGVIEVNHTPRGSNIEFHILHCEIAKYFESSRISFKEIASAGCRWISDQIIAIQSELSIFHITVWIYFLLWVHILSSEEERGRCREREREKEKMGKHHLCYKWCWCWSNLLQWSFLLLPNTEECLHSSGHWSCLQHSLPQSNHRRLHCIQWMWWNSWWKDRQPPSWCRIRLPRHRHRWPGSQSWHHPTTVDPNTQHKHLEGRL